MLQDIITMTTLYHSMKTELHYDERQSPPAVENIALIVQYSPRKIESSVKENK